MDLSTLSTTPVHHADCCLGLSTTLLSSLISTFPTETTTVLSIGSGSGLFEAFLASQAPTLTVEGVEVNTSVNKYLREDNIHVVNGTWDICNRAGDADVWIFVYPRQSGLIRRYFELYGKGTVRLVVYLGPKVDWEEFRDGFIEEGFHEAEIVEDCGLASYEMMAYVRKV